MCNGNYFNFINFYLIRKKCLAHKNVNFTDMKSSECCDKPTIFNVKIDPLEMCLD